MLTLLRAAYELSADRPLPLHPVLPTSTVRGAFGYALAQVIGREESLPAFSDRLRIFREIFSPLAAEGGQVDAMGRRQSARPYVLRGRFTRPDRRAFIVEFILMGQAAEFEGLLDQTMDVLAVMGLGPGGAVSCRLHKCGSERITPDLPEALTDEMMVDFLTPTRLSGGGVKIWGEGVPFSVLIARGLDRLRDLATHYGDGWPHETEADIALKEASRDIPSLLVEGGLMEASRKSQRTHQEVSMSGFVGKMLYRGGFAPFRDILAYLPWIHVGRGAVYGCGQIEYLFRE